MEAVKEESFSTTPLGIHSLRYNTFIPIGKNQLLATLGSSLLLYRFVC